jgi:hypothetical protein
VTLPEVVTGDLTGKFGEMSLYNQHADFEFGSVSNSNSTSPWAIVCEPATQPSCADSPLHEHFPYGLCNANKAHAKALSARRAGKEIVSEYNSDSNTVPSYNSDSNTVPGYNSDSNTSPATTRTPPTSSTSGRTLTSPSPRTTRLSNRCQDRLPAWL